MATTKNLAVPPIQSATHAVKVHAKNTATALVHQQSSTTVHDAGYHR